MGLSWFRVVLSVITFVAGCGGSKPAGGTGGKTGAAGADSGIGAIGGAPADAAVDLSDGAPARDIVCDGPLNQTAPIVRPDVLIELDDSSSMNQDFTGLSCSGCAQGSKWVHTVAALGQVVGESKGNVNWGLSYFASPTGCAVPAKPSIAIGPGSGAAIAALFSAPGGELPSGTLTPTRAAEQAAAAYLQALPDGGAKFILIATDGLPDCAAGASSTVTEDSDATIQAVSAAAGDGIRTFVLAISDVIGTDSTFSMMAVAGNTARATTPSYYPSASEADLIAQLRAIVAQTASCTFSIPPPPDGGTSGDMTVNAAGTLIPRDPSHADGWDYTDGSMRTIRLYGPSCTGAASAGVQFVTLTFSC